MTVRTFFRQLRAAQFNANTGAYITLYFRSEAPFLQGPFSPRVTIYTYSDFDAFIENALRHEYPWRSLDDLHRMVTGPRRWRILSGITE